MKQGDRDDGDGQNNCFDTLFFATTDVSFYRFSLHRPAPHNFSFNTPKGACPTCKGLGVINRIDIDKIIPDKN